jgi:hypothetical protein
VAFWKSVLRQHSFTGTSSDCHDLRSHNMGRNGQGGLIDGDIEDSTNTSHSRNINLLPNRPHPPSPVRLSKHILPLSPLRLPCTLILPQTSHTHLPNRHRRPPPNRQLTVHPPPLPHPRRQIRYPNSQLP